MFRGLSAWLFQKRLKHSTSIMVEASGDINDSPITVSDRDQKDVEVIQSQQATIDAQHKTIDKLLSRDPDADELTRELIADAVSALPETDSDPTEIKRAEQALANGETQLAAALYRTDAERKRNKGHEQLQAAASSYRRLGALAYLDDTSTAIEAYEEAVALWPEDIEAWNELGRLYKRIGKLDNSIDAYERVSNLAKVSDDELMWTAISFGNLGIVYKTKGDLDRAIELYEKSLAINKELGCKEGMASVYGNLGIVYQIKGDLDRAIELYEKSLAINKELGRKEGMANVYGNLGTVYKTKGDLDRARLVWEKAISLFESLDSPSADRVRQWLSDLPGSRF